MNVNFGRRRRLVAEKRETFFCPEKNQGFASFLCLILSFLYFLAVLLSMVTGLKHDVLGSNPYGASLSNLYCLVLAYHLVMFLFRVNHWEGHILIFSYSNSSSIIAFQWHE